MTTFIMLALFATTVLLTLVATVGLLLLGARLARIPQVGFKLALVGALLYTTVSFVAQGIALLIDGDRYPIAGLAIVLGGLAVTWKVLQRVFRTTLGRAVLAWLPTLLTVPLVFVVARFVVQPFLLEAYSIPTNSMAPTIVGEHLETDCPHCGGQLFVTAREPDFPRQEDLGICGECLQTSTVLVPEGKPLAGDRIIAMKFLNPGRWDLIVFQLPENPSIVYVKRLIGLPGEEVAIHDGEVWIDGRLREKPSEIADLRYWGKQDGGFMEEPPTDWGPVTLGDDEYLVLGDFSRRARDSRYWKIGAPGHPPFAVPGSHLVGVVTHSYWPPSRWRIFR